ncbi:MAG TPA: hypothetical protein VGB50_10165 [Flavobacterium sp.]|jgi:hypothetical protein
MRVLYLFIFACAAAQIATAQDAGDLSANQIVQNSITYSGGKAALSKINTLELIYLYLDPEGKSASIIEKRKANTNFTQSIISQNHESQTTFYSGTDIVWVRGNSVRKLNDSGRPEIKLKAFPNIQLAYESLGYSYSRLRDEKFENFDCYVVEAKNNGGYATRNFFDKASFKHLMTVYPDGNKSLMIEDTIVDGVKLTKHILNTDNEGKISQMILVDARINSSISDLWFTSPFTGAFILPQDIKHGKFRAEGSGTVINRNEKTQTEESGGKSMAFSVDWKTDDMFELRTPEQLKGEGTVVRIVSWNKDGYICHVMGLANIGTAEYKRI